MGTRTREHEPPMADPLAYFLTWGTYGTWLPGDDRGWNAYGHGRQLADPARKVQAQTRMTAEACCLDVEQRSIVEQQIEETCKFRGWTLHAVNCRSNHVHVVVTADASPQTVRNHFKAWCTRKLKELQVKRQQVHPNSTESRALRPNWWAERGSQRFINDEDSLQAVIRYVRERQD